MTQDSSTQDYPPFAFDGDAVAASVASMLNEVAECIGAPERFKASYRTPHVEEIKECFNRNCTVWGTMTLSPEGGVYEPIAVPILHPFNGVFVLGNGNGQIHRPPRAKLMFWQPCLVGRPGLWFLRKWKGNDAVAPEHFVSLEGIGARWKGPRTNQEKDKTSSASQKQTFILLPSKMRESLRILEGRKSHISWVESIRGAMPGGSQMTYQELLDRINLAEVDDSCFFDSEDLATKRLMTYQAFVAEKTLVAILRGWLPDFNTDEARGAPPPLWNNGIDGLKIASILRRPMFASDTKDHQWMRVFNPRNAAEAASMLTAFSRNGWKKRSLNNLPGNMRQNHPSFFQHICPVETPESEMVGLSLRLAADARVCGDGRIVPNPKSSGLGYAASLIPFIHHTDAARAMMGAKNYLQALPVRDSEPPLVKTGMEDCASKLSAPLREAEIITHPGSRPKVEYPAYEYFLPSGPESENRGPDNPGLNLLVAYMPYFGYNYNDAIVACEELGARMSIFKHRKKGQGGPGLGKDDARPLKDFNECHRLDLGDKLTGRHGNKGVVATMLPPELMPRLPVDDRLGKLSGRHVDIVLNPLGVISRMNIGQLLESHLGLLKKIKGEDAFPDGFGKPFEQVDAEMLRQKLLEINADGTQMIDRLGRIRLKIPQSLDSPDNVQYVQTRSPVVVGVQYFVRLDHIPALKAVFRPRPETSLDDGLASSSAQGTLNGYDLITGQAQQGRAHKGGQKIGKMDFWSLEAYGADAIINRVLTDAFRNDGGEDADGATYSQTFRAIRDMFFAMGVDLSEPDQQRNCNVRWSTDEMVKAKGRRLFFREEVPEIKLAKFGEFRCQHSNCEKCHVIGSGTVIDGDKPTGICVEDVLRERGIVLADLDYMAPLRQAGILVDEAGEPMASGNSSELGRGDRLRLATGVEVRVVKICPKTRPNLSEKGGPKRNRSFHFELIIGIDIDIIKHHIYCLTTKDVLTLSDFLEMRVAGRKHTSEWLSCDIPGRPIEVASYGGLSDPMIFGNANFDWGYIELRNPSATRQTLGLGAAGCPDISVVPVLPRRYRKGRMGSNKQWIPSKLTRLYEALATAQGAEKPDANKQDRILSQLFGEIKECLDGKGGLVRGSGLSRRIDGSGRFVQIPGPRLKIDECGFSPTTLESMFPSQPGEASCLSPQENGSVADPLKDSHVPPKVVMIHRAPMLHRYNFKALGAVPLGDCCGNKSVKQPHVVSVHPLNCASMASDFDGDEIGVYTVIPEELPDAERMRPTVRENLLSLAGGAPVLGFDQDMILGTYLLSRGGRRSELESWCLYEGCAECDGFRQIAAWDEDACIGLIKHLCEDHVSEGPEDAVARISFLAQQAFRHITHAGVSFGYFDLMACEPDVGELKKLRDACGTEGCIPSEEFLEKWNEELESLTKRRLESILEGGIETPGHTVAAMVLSKARGAKQIRQIVAARGFLAPGHACFPMNADKFLFPESLLKGMPTPDRFFHAAMNGRSSMIVKKLGTQKAGTITNKMAMLLWAWTIQGDDCSVGDTDAESGNVHSISKCRNQSHTICRRCYGALPNGQMPPDGFRIGLVAAQSIGERGTQLSMKTAHSSGETEVDINELKKLLNELGKLCDNPDRLKKRILEIKYDCVDYRHFQLLGLAIQHPGPERSSIDRVSTAIHHLCSGNVFNALAYGTMWSRLGSIIKSPPRAVEDGGQGTTPAPVARLFMGMPGQNPEPVYVCNTVGYQPGAPAGEPVGALPDQDAGLDEDDDEHDDDDDDDDDDDFNDDDDDEQTEESGLISVEAESDDAADMEQDKEYLPAEHNIIAMVFVPQICGNPPRIYIEVSHRTYLSSIPVRIAHALAGYLSCSSIEDTFLSKRMFANQDAIIKALAGFLIEEKMKAILGETKEARKTNMSKFVTRTIVFYPYLNQSLPLRAMIGKNACRFYTQRNDRTI